MNTGREVGLLLQAERTIKLKAGLPNISLAVAANIRLQPRSSVRD